MGGVRKHNEASHSQRVRDGRALLYADGVVAIADNHAHALADARQVAVGQQGMIAELAKEVAGVSQDSFPAAGVLMPRRQRIRKSWYLGANRIRIEPTRLARGGLRIPTKLRAECRDRVDAIGMLQCQVRRDVTTHAVAKQRRAIYPQCVEQVDDVLGEAFNAKWPPPWGRVRVTLEIELVNAEVRCESGGEAVELIASAQGAMKKDKIPHDCRHERKCEAPYLRCSDRTRISAPARAARTAMSFTSRSVSSRGAK